MTRRGQHAAFEVLCLALPVTSARLLPAHARPRARTPRTCSRRSSRPPSTRSSPTSATINVRPWLYRIARNRSLNHLRRASAIGVDSMDVHYADNGLSTGERVLRRESFRQLLGDVKDLPETQRTALLLREIDALSYEQIAHAMETTVPSVKSLLVRARISLAEAAEARQLSCEEVRLALGEVAEGLTKLGAPARRHVRDCERCRSFKQQLKANNHALAAIFPVGPLLLAKKLLLTKLGSTASAGHVGAGAGARPGRGPPPPPAPRAPAGSAYPAGCSRLARAPSRPRRSPGSPPRRSSPRSRPSTSGLLPIIIAPRPPPLRLRASVAPDRTGRRARHRSAGQLPGTSVRGRRLGDTACGAARVAKPPKLASTGTAALVHTAGVSSGSRPSTPSLPPKPVPPPQVTEVTTQTTALPTQTRPRRRRRRPPPATPPARHGRTDRRRRPRHPAKRPLSRRETARPRPHRRRRSPPSPAPEAETTTHAPTETTGETAPPGRRRSPEPPA